MLRLVTLLASATNWQGILSWKMSLQKYPQSHIQCECTSCNACTTHFDLRPCIFLMSSHQTIIIVPISAGLAVYRQWLWQGPARRQPQQLNKPVYTHTKKQHIFDRSTIRYLRILLLYICIIMSSNYTNTRTVPCCSSAEYGAENAYSKVHHKVSHYVVVFQQVTYVKCETWIYTMPLSKEIGAIQSNYFRHW